MQIKSPVLVQALAAGFSAVLALQAVWIVAAELARPRMPFFPTNEHEARAIAMHHSSAASAAWIGWPRGELWVDYAMTANAALFDALLGAMEYGRMAGTRPDSSDLSNGAGGIAGTAATLARTDARAWLVLAMNIQSGPDDGRGWAQLEMLHSSLPYAAEHHSLSGSSALIDWPRDEFWAEYAAITNAAPSGASEYARLRSVPAIDKKASSVAETAATLAPTDARAWLVLAINTQPAPEDGRALAQLKMSYYTSPYSNDLFSLRIQIAAQSLREPDEELSNFLEGELESVIRYKPSLKQSITPAYRTASPAGRRFLEITLAKIDPNYLAELKSNLR